jgi:hypothetical protein
MKKAVKGKSRDAIKPAQSASQPTSQPVLLWLGVGLDQIFDAFPVAWHRPGFRLNGC